MGKLLRTIYTHTYIYTYTYTHFGILRFPPSVLNEGSMKYVFAILCSLVCFACSPLPTRGDIVRTALEEYETSKVKGVDPYKYIPPGGESRYHDRWCGEFVQWVYSQHMPVFSPLQTGTRTLNSVFVYFDATTRDINVASAGDALFLDLDSEDGTDHVGIFIGRTQTGKFLTVEGNVAKRIVVTERNPDNVFWVGLLTDEIRGAFEMQWKE